MLASIVFSARQWILPSAAFGAVALAWMVWSYQKNQGDPVVRAVCFLCKALGVFALAVCLLEPVWTGQRARPGANLIAVVADNSAGMQIKDRGQSETRGDSLRKLLAEDKNSWQARLDENFQVSRYLFDSRLQPSKDFNELIFDGRSSAIGSALRTLKERFANRPLAGVILLTDGNATDIAGTLPDLTGLPPVYPVVIGRDDPIKDIALQAVNVSQTSFEDAPVTIQADVSASGYVGSTIVAQLLDSTGKKVQEETSVARRDGDPLPFRFQVRPDKNGLSFYRLRVSAREELGQFEHPASSLEATLANNSRILAVDRGRGPFRILYVAGRPNWEYKFLHRALEDDDQLQLVGLIRIAKREPKFEFRGRQGESSNPLFRGFGNQSKEEVERYDQPVLVRLNTRDQLELRGGFPKTPEELYGYDAVVIDDLEAEFFTQDQAMLLQKFVSERGGGFLMLGGMETFVEGKYHRTPIGEMLPVYLDRAPLRNPGPLRLSLTREGWLQPWARLRNNESDEKLRIDQMPPFLVMNTVREVKPGASIVASAADSQGKSYPALVVQRFGRGRTAALTVGDLWHWGLHDAEAHRDMDKAWRQMMRWLVSDVPGKIDLQTEIKREDPNGAVHVQVRVRDDKFQPLENTAVSLRIQPVMAQSPGSETNFIRLTAEASATEPGLYEATFIPRETAGFRCETTVTNAVGAELGRVETGWSSDLAAEEFKSLKPNRALLATIAQRTGGEIVPALQLEEFTRRLPSLRAPITETWSYPIWHTPAVFAFALFCFLCEWGLRRWKGMA